MSDILFLFIELGVRFFGRAWSPGGTLVLLTLLCALSVRLWPTYPSFTSFALLLAPPESLTTKLGSRISPYSRPRLPMASSPRALPPATLRSLARSTIPVSPSATSTTSGRRDTWPRCQTTRTRVAPDTSGASRLSRPWSVGAEPLFLGTRSSPRSQPSPVSPVA